MRVGGINAFEYPGNTPSRKNVRQQYRPVNKEYRVGVQTACGAWALVKRIPSIASWSTAGVLNLLEG